MPHLLYIILKLMHCLVVTFNKKELRDFKFRPTQEVSPKYLNEESSLERRS